MLNGSMSVSEFNAFSYTDQRNHKKSQYYDGLRTRDLTNITQGC
jgi:hypothetical protein